MENYFLIIPVGVLRLHFVVIHGSKEGITKVVSHCENGRKHKSVAIHLRDSNIEPYCF